MFSGTAKAAVQGLVACDWRRDAFAAFDHVKSEDLGMNACKCLVPVC